MPTGRGENHPHVLEWTDEDMAMHWIDRYVAGIDGEPQMDRILDCVGIRSSLVGTACPGCGPIDEAEEKARAMELIARLREVAMRYRTGVGLKMDTSPLLDEAAAALTSLSARLAAAQLYGKMLETDHVPKAKLEAAEARLAEVEQERDRQYDENVNRIAAEGAAILRAEAAEDRIATLTEALEPFARNVDATSLAKACGHVTREHLHAARAALHPEGAE